MSWQFSVIGSESVFIIQMMIHHDIMNCSFTALIIETCTFRTGLVHEIMP